MSDLRTTYLKQAAMIHHLTDQLEAAKSLQDDLIARRYNELIVMLQWHDPDKYGNTTPDPFKLDSRHTIELRDGSDTVIITMYSQFHGEWDENSVTIPANLFWGYEDAEAVFAQEAKDKEAQAKLVLQKAREENEQRERKLYEQLKKKYGG